jgi:pyruvate/2-oxoacid:ferredoxin oxidoreductase alpha subunit
MIEQFEMERMQSTWENRVAHNLSESGVVPMTVEELLDPAEREERPGEVHLRHERQVRQEAEAREAQCRCEVLHRQNAGDNEARVRGRASGEVRELPEDDYIVEIGKARIAREGRDVSIITFGAQVLTALDAAEELEKEGLDVEVIDLRTLAPMDKEAILASVKKTSRALILHEASLTGGIGGEISAIISQEAFEWLDAPVVRVASIDTPVPYSPPLEDYYLPQVKDVLDAARKLAAY